MNPSQTESLVLGKWINKNAATITELIFKNDHHYLSTGKTHIEAAGRILDISSNSRGTFEIKGAAILLNCESMWGTTNGERTDHQDLCTADEFCVLRNINGKCKLGFFNKDDKPENIDSLAFIGNSSNIYSKQSKAEEEAQE
jgi:hypothetical protein